MNGNLQSQHPTHPLARSSFRYWLFGRSASNLGSAVTSAVLPLIAVVSLHTRPTLVAIVVGIPMVTAMLGRLAASVHAERLPGRTAPLVVLDGARILVVATVPALWLASSLTTPVLMVEVGIIGALDGAFGAYGGPFVVGLVPDEELVTANGMLQTSGNVASVAGPGLAALVLEFVTPPLVLFAEVASYLFALPALLRLRRLPPGQATRDAPAADEAESPAANVPGGFTAPFADGNTRGLLAGMLIVTVVNGMILAELAVFMVRHLHLASSLVALVGAAGAIGGVGSGILVGYLVKSVGEKLSFYIAMTAMAISFVFLPLARSGLVGLWPCLLYEFLSSSGGTLVIVIAFTIVQRQLPREQLARGMASAALIPEIGQFIGTGIASLVVALIGVTRLFAVASALGVAIIVVVLVFGLLAMLRGRSHVRSPQ